MFYLFVLFTGFLPTAVGKHSASSSLVRHVHFGTAEGTDVPAGQAEVADQVELLANGELASPGGETTSDVSLEQGAHKAQLAQSDEFAIHRLQPSQLAHSESARDLACQLHKGLAQPQTAQERNMYNHNGSIVGRLQKLGLSLPTPPQEDSELPKIIWSFWDGAALGPVEELAVSSWRRMNPGWTVNVLNFTSAMELLHQKEPESKAFVENLDSWARKTDLIRLMLLRSFGGVWVDATLFCTRPLDSYVHKMVGAANFTAPTWNEPRQPCGTPGTFDAQMSSMDGLSSHFLVAVPHSYVVEKWLYAFSQILYNGPCGDPAEWGYFLVHQTFESLIDTDKHFAKKWEAAFKLNSVDTHSVHNLEAVLTPQLKALIDHPKAPVWKFNKMTGDSVEDAHRCADASFVCGYIKSRFQQDPKPNQKSADQKSLWGSVNYQRGDSLTTCNLPDLWLEKWEIGEHGWKTEILMYRHRLSVLSIGVLLWFALIIGVWSRSNPLPMKPMTRALPVHET